MAKIYVQQSTSAFNYNSSLATAGSTSGSFFTAGYSAIGGMAISTASLATIRLYQSINGTNWDYWQDFALSACSGSTYSASVAGKYAMVTACGGATASSASVRVYFFMRPI